jgi:hypothetical protein
MGLYQVGRVRALLLRGEDAMSNRILAMSVLISLAAVAVVGCDPGPATGNGAAATAPAVTPAQSASSAQSAVPGSVCETSAAKGNCGPYLDHQVYRSDGQNTFVGQDVWNQIPGWSQTIQASGPGNWTATADMPAGNTSVVSFPNVGQQFYYKNVLSGFTSIYSSFNENMHPKNGTSAEAAYDIWLNDWGNEVMIQHDIVNRGTCPVLSTTVFGGHNGVPAQDWSLCKYGSELIWQLAGKGEQSGSVDILDMLTWLEVHGYLPSGSGLTDVSYGFEICSTGGQPEKFTVSRFTISAA